MKRTVFPRNGRPGIDISSEAIQISHHDDISKQTYIDRVRSYVPVEVIAFFIFVNSIINDDALLSEGLSIKRDGYIAIATLFIGLAATVIYIRRCAMQETNPAWKINAIISSFAFIIWTYAMNAKYLSVFGIETTPSISGFLLASFTLFSGLLVPVAQERNPA